MANQRRRSTRITIGFKAELIAEGETYAGEVENLSEDGACIITIPSLISVELETGKEHELILYLFGGETLRLKCKLMWTRLISSHGHSTKIGIELIDPPWDSCSLFL